MSQKYFSYINGEFIDTSETQQIINPANGEVIAEVSTAGEKEAESALSFCREAFDKSGWKTVTLSERKEFLLKISQGILDKAADLAKLETLNTGKPIKESTFMDIPSSAKVFEHFALNFEKYLLSQTLEIDSQIASAQASLIREPLGVSVLIVPWNYPLLIASWKLAQSLAAGNTVILKPSSLTPLTALELAKIIHKAGLPKGVVNVISGSGETIGETLCSDKRVDLISFTGSNEVGSKVLNYASQNVKKVTAELGGKSASIILKDADLEAALNSSLCSVFLNQGQMCTAMSRILVEDEIYENFVNEFVQRTKRLKLGEGLDFETQMGPLISEAQRKKALSFVENAEAQGAKLACGGKVPDGTQFKYGYFFEPAVFTDVPLDSQLYKEEVFGPVACINKFSSIEEAISLANDSLFGLAACVWTKDEFKAKEIAKKLNAGSIWINTYGMFFNEVPYGGFKQSGFGKELGREGFLEYTRLKNVIIDKSKDSKPLVNYWYGF